MFCLRPQSCLLPAVLLAVCAVAQTDAAAPAGVRAEIRSVVVVPGESGPLVQIISTRPITPQLQTVDGPLRLVIDLPGSTLAAARKRIPFRNQQIKGVRISQYQDNPPITRVVVDLAAPVLYTWDAMGNHLNVRMHADENATAKPPSVPAFTAGVQPAAVPVAIGSSGSLVETGSRVAAGSSITAGEETAVLRLTRGGEVQVCPGTTVSVSTSSSGQDLMLGMSTGALETHYVLENSVDTVLTPDFRVVLPGPGQFNLAVGADSRGNTCVASLPGSTSSAVVAELLGSGTFEIRPNQQVLFRQGRLDSVENPPTYCGCPPPREPVLRAAVDASQVQAEPKPGEKMRLSNSADPRPADAPPSMAPTASDSGTKAQSAKVEMDSALIFRGRDRAKAKPAAPPAPTEEVASLPLTARQRDPLPATIVIPPDPKPPHKSFLRRFFGAIFR